jgi:hypothetical protein
MVRLVIPVQYLHCYKDTLYAIIMFRAVLMTELGGLWNVAMP